MAPTLLLLWYFHALSLNLPKWYEKNLVFRKKFSKDVSGYPLGYNQLHKLVIKKFTPSGWAYLNCPYGNKHIKTFLFRIKLKIEWNLSINVWQYLHVKKFNLF